MRCVRLLMRSIHTICYRCKHVFECANACGDACEDLHIHSNTLKHKQPHIHKTNPQNTLHTYATDFNWILPNTKIEACIRVISPARQSSCKWRSPSLHNLSSCRWARFLPCARLDALHAFFTYIYSIHTLCIQIQSSSLQFRSWIAHTQPARVLLVCTSSSVNRQTRPHRYFASTNGDGRQPPTVICHDRRTCGGCRYSVSLRDLSLER